MSRRRIERRGDLTEAEAAFLNGGDRPEGVSQWEWYAIDCECCPWMRPPGRPSTRELWDVHGPAILAGWPPGKGHPLLRRFGPPRGDGDAPCH